MSSENDQPVADGGTLEDKSPDQQLAAKISTELVSRSFAPNEKRDSLATKIAAGQMNAEDWRIMAASTLQNDTTEPEYMADIDTDGERQS